MNRFDVSLRALALAALVPFAAGCTALTDIDTKIDVGLLLADTNGQVSLDQISATRDLGSIRNSLDETLDLADTNVAPYGRVQAGVGPHRVQVSAFGFSESGGGVLDADFGVLTAGTGVNADLDVYNIKAFYSYGWNIGPLRIGPGIGVDIIATDIDVTNLSGTAFEQIETSSPIPMVFAQAELDLEVVSALLEVGAMAADLDDADGTWWDIEAMVRVHPFAGWHLMAGYRFIDQDTEGEADNAPFDGDLDVQGWLIGGGITF